MIDILEIDRVKSEIVPIIAQRIQLRRSGGNLVGRCCWHDDRHPSFTVSERRRTWRCWSCNVGGDAIDFIQKFHGVDFKGALAILGITNDDRDPERSRQFMRALEEIKRDESALLQKLEERESGLQFLNHQVNWLINSVEPLEREAAWFSTEHWLDAEFEAIEKEREKIDEIARRHRREVAEWVN